MTIRSKPSKPARCVSRTAAFPLGWMITAAAALALPMSPTSAPAHATPAPSCAAGSEYHLLDFWIGEWDVLSDGEPAGTNRIEPILGGCALRESWRSAGGGRGESLFYYIPATGDWKQVWVTERGTTPGGVKEKRLVERLAGGAVRFQGKIPVAGGEPYLDRTTLTPQDDGRVRQVIETSTDGGETWVAGFDAVYVRSAAATAERQLMEADRAFDKAAAKRGIDGWVSYFTSDAARVIPKGPIARGHEEIRELDGPAFADPKTMLTWEPVDAGLFDRGDHGYTRGRYRMVSVGDGKGESLSTGWYLSIWRLEPEGWKVILDTGARDEPPR